MTAMSILICVIVLNLHHRDPNRPVPPWLQRTVTIMTYVVCMRGRLRLRTPTVYQLCEFAREQFSPDSSRDRYSGTSFDDYNQSTYHRDTSCPEDNGLFDHVGYFLSRGSNKRVIMEEILRHLRQICLRLKEKEEQDSLKADWKIVAKILDRFFLLVFVLLVFVSSAVLLFLYPISARKIIL